MRWKYKLNGIKGRLDTAEEKLEDTVLEIPKWNIEEKRDSFLSEQWDNFKWPNIHIIRVLKERRKLGTEKIFEELTAEIFQIGWKLSLQIQEVQWTPSTRHMKETTQTHIIIKLLKISDKVKILKVAGEGEGDMLHIEKEKDEIIEMRRQWHNIIKVLKEKLTRILFQWKYLFLLLVHVFY